MLELNTEFEILIAEEEEEEDEEEVVTGITSWTPKQTQWGSQAIAEEEEDL
ncbi:MAG: hypothetical protein F6J98_02070 [Moorea sp. SIO4G2]|nr:hypothetical protein [Moorena sp. SIO4G2]